MTKADERKHVYTLKYDRRDIVASFDADTRNRVNNLLKLPPLKSFECSFNEAHQQFNPHVLIGGSPCSEHRKIADSYKQELARLIETYVTLEEEKCVKAALQEELESIYKDVELTDRCFNAAKFQERYQRLINLEEDLIKRSGNSLNADDLKAKLKGIFKNSLSHTGSTFGNSLSGSWPLAWYWKSIFTTLPTISTLKLNSKKAKAKIKFIIRVSQIRQWILVAVYTQEETNKKAPDFGAPKRILLRAPLFGRAERFMTWDQYFSICIPRFQVDIHQARIKIDSDSSLSHLRKHEELYYILGRHDLIYEFELPIKKRRHTSVTVGLEVNLYPFRAEDWQKEKLKDELALSGAVNIQYPHDFVSIPVFWKDRTKREKEQRILLASDSVCRAYELLSEIWNDKTAKAVLVIAPPGSGKELLADSNFHFQAFEGDLVKYALSPSSHEGNERSLFSREIQVLYEHNWINQLIVATGPGNPLTPAVQQYVEVAHLKLVKLLTIQEEIQDWVVNPSRDEKTPEHLLSDGLIFKSRQGVLVLDEIDKVPDQTRASLLRLLENDEFALCDTSIILNLDKWRPLYVFAGSTPKAQMYQLGPKDFWTRISHIVEMSHPLDVDDKNDRKRICKSYFSFFWVAHIDEFFSNAKMLPFKTTGTVKDFFQNYYEELFYMLINYEVIDSIADMFADELESGVDLKEISIRNIRSIVNRATYGLADYLLYDGRGVPSKLSLLRHEVVTEKYKAKKRWFDLLGVVITVVEEPIEKEKPIPYTEGIREEIRQILRSAIFKILHP